tara:strand:- start:958 stop:1263 length:306 start_codon:yes stop_codon:yes gene_type:complete
MAKNKKKKISKIAKIEIPTTEFLVLTLKSDKFNAQYTDINGYGVDVQMLEKVYLRGSESLVDSPQDRVNQFMYLVRSGKPLNPEYTQDFDLLPEGHPKRKI